MVMMVLRTTEKVMVMMVMMMVMMAAILNFGFQVYTCRPASSLSSGCFPCDPSIASARGRLAFGFNCCRKV